MKILTLQKIPHIITKSDSSPLEQEQKEQEEMRQETQEVFEYPLRTNTTVEMVFQGSDDRRLIEVKYCLNEENINSFSLPENLQYFQFNLSETAISNGQVLAGDELLIFRKVCYMPVGNLANLHNQMDIMPLMSKFKAERTFVIPLTQQVNLLTLNYKWKHLLTSLTKVGGQLTLKIQKVVLSHFDVNYALQCLKYYTDTYQGKLSPEEIDRNTKTYQAIISGEETFTVCIYIKSHHPQMIKQAFFQDIDVNAFSLHPNELERFNWSSVDQEEKKFIKKLQLLWSLDEVLQLLTPPYTFKNALPGIAHFVPKPFLAPFMGLNSTQTKNSLLLGLLDNKREIHLNLKQLQQHVFVTGTSGGGKTHTVHHLLHQLSGTIPLLIIDPAKREYETLMKQLGKADKIIDFKDDNYPRFNPFIAPDNITLYSHSSILAKALAILFPTNEVAYELILQMVRQTYIKKLCQFFQQTITLEQFLSIKGNFLRQNPTCIPSFQEFLDIGIAWLKKQVDQNSRWGQEAVEHFERRWAFLQVSLFKHIFSSNEPADRYFESDYLIELCNVLDANERNAIFAVFVALLYEHRKSQGLQESLIHLTVLEEAHQIIPAKQPGLGENMVSSPAYEASKLLADMLAEIRAYGEGIIVVDQSASKIIPDVLINRHLQDLQFS